jgi:DNA-binding NarL/FixJ family response regulator
VLLREGLARILRDEGCEIVAQAGDANEAVRKVRAHRPDVAVIDIRMPPENRDDGLRAAHLLRSELPDVGVVVLSQYVEESYAHELFASGASGLGYLLKDRVANTKAFADAVRRVGSGGSALDPEVVARLLGRRTTAALEALSPREREVLARMAEGLSNQAIAEQLVISERGVEKHITNIFWKLKLPENAARHRRVLAVLKYLNA